MYFFLSQLLFLTTFTATASCRYLIACEALYTTKQARAFPAFESAFREFGLPWAIRTDNAFPLRAPTLSLD
jgi:putative transposase